MRMLREVTERELEPFMEISINAYPGMKIVSPEERERFRQRLIKVMAEPMVHLVGLFEDEVMIGAMRLYDFQMKLRGPRTLVGGVGGVAVDLTRKKEKVARDMIRFFLEYYRQQGACLTALYPFRPDFYRRMGFGYGGKLDQYYLKPVALPGNGEKSWVSLLTAVSQPDLAACYDRFITRSNGLMERPSFTWEGIFNAPGVKVAGYQQDGRLQGYLIFLLQPKSEHNFLQQDLMVRELVYETPAALRGLLAFLRSQADQVDRIALQTQDPDLYFLFDDPRDDSNRMLPSVWHQANVQGVGIMYRVINVPRLFAVLADHPFNGSSGRFCLELSDNFLPENAGRYGVVVENGRLHLTTPSPNDPTLSLNVADFSALITGAIGLRSLVQYGQATLSDPTWLDTLHQLFHTDQKPLCLTSF